jgi:hypothetical protein
MTISAATLIRRFAFAISLLAIACSRPDASAEVSAKSSYPDHVGIALHKFKQSGPGTVTRAHCEEGVPSVTSRDTESTLLCKGPNGSQTTTVVRVRAGKRRSRFTTA